MYCLDLKGNEIWRFKTGGAIYQTLKVFEGIVYVGSFDCHLYALDAGTGKERWRFTSSSLVQSVLPPASEDYELVVKKSASEESLEENDKYEVNVSLVSGGEYKSESEYQIKVEYHQKMKY